MRLIWQYNVVTEEQFLYCVIDTVKAIQKEYVPSGSSNTYI